MTSFKGAEATVEIKETKVIKKRERKNYRHPDLDKRLRDDRTEAEKRLMEDARQHSVNVPKLEKVDDSTLEMQRINGKPLKSIIDNNPSVMKDLGDNIALLHATNIIHGDLTTSNVLVDEKPYIIDFGLSFRSERLEDKAVDIHLFKQVLNSSHPELADKSWKLFLEGYRDYEESEEVLKQLKEVEKRGRYK